jgi:hypothetical protein
MTTETPFTLSRYGLAGMPGQLSRVIAAHGDDADQLVDGRLVRFWDFRVAGSPQRLAVCRRARRQGPGDAVAELEPVLSLVPGEGR